MSKRLISTGLQIDKLIVPAFEVSDNEQVGLAVPIDYDERWYRLMQVLTSRSTPSISIAARVMLIDPPAIELGSRKKRELPVRSYIQAAGLSCDLAGKICDNIGISRDQLQGTLPLTTRLLVDLSIAGHRNTQFIVLSTAGLDPNGIGRVAAAIPRLARCAALDVISSSLVQCYESIEAYTRVIRCKAM